MKNKHICERCGIELTEENKYQDDLCQSCAYELNIELATLYTDENGDIL